jgi:hypothetical protein
MKDELKRARTDRIALDDGRIGYEYKTKTEKTVKNCPFHIPITFQEKILAPPRARGQRKDPAKKYPQLWREAERGQVSNNTLLDTYKLRMMERPIFFAYDETGEAAVYRGMVKGCDAYNSMIKDRCDFQTEKLLQEYKCYYFLTLTYAINTYGRNIIEAWRIFNHQLKVIFKALRNKYNMGYVCVLEATNKGYPHAHIILGTIKPVEKFHKKLTDGKEIETGKLYHFIDDRVASPVFKLQKAGGEGLKKYLGKYVTKSTEEITKNKKPKNKTLKAADRKALLSCLMPVLAQVRQFRFSGRSGLVEQAKELDFTEEEIDVLRAAVEIGMPSEGADLILIRSLNKLLPRCRAHVWGVFFSPIKKFFEQDIGYYSTAPPEVEERFKRGAYPLGCPGCIITKLYDKLTGKNYLHPKPVADVKTPGVLYLPDSDVTVRDALQAILDIPRKTWANITMSERLEFINMGLLPTGNAVYLLESDERDMWGSQESKDYKNKNLSDLYLKKLKKIFEEKVKKK